MGAASGVWAIHGSENGRLLLGGDITRADTSASSSPAIGR